MSYGVRFVSQILTDTDLMSRQSKPKKNIIPARDRIDLRADPSWVARVEKQAERFGVNLSAYIREAVTRRLEADEESDPSLSAD